MVYRKELFLVALSEALIRIRGQIMLGEADKDPALFTDILDIMGPIPSALLGWAHGSGLNQYKDMLSRAEKHGRLEQVERWLSNAEGAIRGVISNEGNNPREYPLSRSKEVYFKLLEKVLDKMAKQVDDLRSLRTYADVFHNLPNNLCDQWNEESERRAYETLMGSAQGNGVWEEVEQWLHEIESEVARTPPD